MASIRERSARDGTVRYAVLWREGGRQTSLTLDTERLAEGFKARLELDGAASAAAWLARQADSPEATEWTLDAWMGHYITHLTSVTEGTRDEYRRLYKRTWGRELGRLPVDAVNKDRLSIAVNTLAKRLSHKSIQNARGLLAAAFDAAVEHDDLPVTRNPAKRIRLPQVGGTPDDEDADDKCYLSHAEFAQLYAEIPAYWQPLVLTLVSTGMRWSEATALPISALDLVATDDKPATLRVARAWKRIPGGWEIGPPKTKKSKRTIDLPLELAEVLGGVVAGRPRTAHVFLSRNGAGHVHHANFRQRVWLPAIARAGLDRQPRIHDLRHTHVAWLIAAGIDLPTIQRRLGHESIQTTVDVYGDLLPDVRMRAASAASTALRRLELEPARS